VDKVDELKLIRNETIQLLKLGAFEQMGLECPELLKIDNYNRVPVIIRDNVADSCISRHAVELELSVSVYVLISLQI